MASKKTKKEVTEAYNKHPDRPNAFKGKFLIGKNDFLTRDMPEKDKRDIALCISIDMFEIHQQIEDKMERFDILVKYFTERQGVWDEECKKPEEMAMKMVLMGEIAEISTEICKLTEAHPKDFRISFEICGDSSIGVNVGLHKKLPKSRRNILEKLINIHVGTMLDRMKHEYPRVMMHLVDRDDKEGIKYAKELIKMSESNPEIDEEARKVLERMQWDKTSMGEA